MGRKSGSYKFEKRQKELKKQKKKREKIARRLNKGSEADDEPRPSGWEGALFDTEDGVANDDDVDPDDETDEEDT